MPLSQSPFTLVRRLVFVLATLGCASTGFLMATPKVTMYGPSYPAKDTLATIEVFDTRRPDREFTEIAQIEVGDTDDNYSMKQILRKAREIGADGVILMGRVGSMETAVPAGRSVLGITEGYGIVAVAIRFKAK